MSRVGPLLLRRPERDCIAPAGGFPRPDLTVTREVAAGSVNTRTPCQHTAERLHSVPICSPADGDRKGHPGAGTNFDPNSRERREDAADRWPRVPRGKGSPSPVRDTRGEGGENAVLPSLGARVPGRGNPRLGGPGNEPMNPSPRSTTARAPTQSIYITRALHSWSGCVESWRRRQDQGMKEEGEGQGGRIKKPRFIRSLVRVLRGETGIGCGSSVTWDTHRAQCIPRGLKREWISGVSDSAPGLSLTGTGLSSPPPSPPLLTPPASPSSPYGSVMAISSVHLGYTGAESMALGVIQAHLVEGGTLRRDKVVTVDRRKKGNRSECSTIPGINSTTWPFDR